MLINNQKLIIGVQEYGKTFWDYIDFNLNPDYKIDSIQYNVTDGIFKLNVSYYLGQLIPYDKLHYLVTDINT